MSIPRLSLLAISVFLFAALTFGNAPAQAGDTPKQWGKKLEKEHEKDWEVSTTPTGAAYQILTDLASVKPEETWAKGACQLAALNVAWDIWGNAQGVGITKAWGKTIKDIESEIWGLGKEGLQEYVTGKIKDGYKDGIKDTIKDFFKGKKPKADVFKWAGKRGNCDFALYVVIDVPNSRTTILIHGNCHCTPQRCYNHEQSTKLAAFSIELEGGINYKIGKHKIESVSLGPLKKVNFNADCLECGEAKTGTHPDPVPPATPGNSKDGGSGKTDPGGKKPEEKTCPPCEDTASELEKAETERDNLLPKEQGLRNTLTDIENGRHDKADKPMVEKELKRIEEKKKELDKKIEGLRKKVAKCEKEKCSDEPGNDDEHASRPVKDGAMGFVAAEKSHHLAEEVARGEEEGHGRGAADDWRDPETGCVATVEHTAKLPPAERAAARQRDKERLEAEVEKRRADEKQASKKYDDAIAKLERRRYANFVTSDQTYTSEKRKLRQKREEDTASLHNDTLKAQKCRDNYLKAAGEFR